MKKVITFIAIAAITLSTAQKTAAQEIDAPEVWTWTADKQAITPDHKYNSISIYLLNAGSIENLYSGKSLPEEKDIPKEERNRLKELKKNLKGGDYAKYIYLSAELEDPKNREVLTFPIYCLDRQDSKRQTFDSREKVPILSKVDDSFLQTELSAKGSITAIKGNKNAETLQKIGDITIGLLETALAIKNGPMGAPEILDNLKTGAECFKNMAKNKETTSLFDIPIVTEEDIEGYKLYKVNVQQIKWREYGSAESVPLQDFNNAKNLSWKEVRAKLAGRDVPYLVVVWHKSEYSLPNDWKKNAAITREYYDRRNKETRFSGWKNDMERHFLGALNNAITIDRSASGYIEDRKGGRTAYDKISEIINAYYNILNINNLLKDKFSAPEQKKYYESDYREASASLTEQVRNLLKDDINLESARKTVDWYFDAQNGDLSSMSADKLYETIKHLAYYRNIVKNNNLSFSDFYASYNNLLLKLENTLYDAAFLTTTSGDPKKQFLTKKVAAYPDCEECRTKANAEIVAINSATNNQLKTRLKDLQNEYIATIKRWNEISHSITDSIKNTDISVYQEQVNQRDIIDAMSKDYLEIKNINVHSLASDITKERLNEYLTKRQNVLVALSRLYASKLFDEQTYAAFLDWKKEYDFQ